METTGIPRVRWKGNVVINIKEISWEDFDWIELTLDGMRDTWLAVVNATTNLRFPQNTRSFLTTRRAVVVSRTLPHGVSLVCTSYCLSACFVTSVTTQLI